MLSSHMYVSDMNKTELNLYSVSSIIGVNASGDTFPAIFGQQGTEYLISPGKCVKFLLSDAKRHGS